MPADSPWSLVLAGALYEADATAPGGRRRVVYQGVAPGMGNLAGSPDRSRQKRAHVIPADPRTPYQRALRQRMADATAAWHLLTAPQRAEWRARASSAHCTGFNLHVRDWCRAHPLNPADYPADPQEIHLALALVVLPRLVNLGRPPTTAGVLNLGALDRPYPRPRIPRNY